VCFNAGFLVSSIDFDLLDFIAVPVFVLEWNQSGQMIYAEVNDCWCKAAKQSAFDVIGKTAVEVFANRYGTIAYAHHMKAANTREMHTYDLVLPLGANIRDVRTTLIPRLDAAGEVVQLIGTSVDRTGEVQALDMQADVATASCEIEDFIALAAHDLRAPMRNVGHLTNMLREDFEDRGDGKLEVIDLLEDVVVKATDLITDVLAQAQAGQIRREQTEFEMASLIGDVFAMLDPLRKHKLSTQDHWISTNRTMFQIILRNLLDNAIKHSGRDTVELNVGARQDNNGMILITVQDNGVGFKNPAIAFLDGGKLRSDSGFGLFGIRRLIGSENGEIWATNLPDNSGSCIELTMPGAILYPEAASSVPALRLAF